jgi:MraZ protein
MFFMGTFTPKLDDKGRLFLPAKFRDQLAEGLVITRGQERCLTVWTAASFQEEARRAQDAPVTQRSTRDYTRFLFAGASDEQPDKQGRITIPPTLREYAGLTRDVVVIGVMNRVEIWDQSRWDTYSAGGEAAFSDLSEPIFPGS